MHGDVSHGPQIDPEPELVACEILGQGHVGPPLSGGGEVTREFLPHVAAADALVVHPVGHAVYCNFNLGYVGIEVVFCVPGPGCVGVNAEKQDTLELPALRVHPQVQPGLRASCDGHNPFTHDEVVRELLAGLIRTHCLGG